MSVLKTVEKKGLKFLMDFDYNNILAHIAAINHVTH